MSTLYITPFHHKEYHSGYGSNAGNYYSSVQCGVVKLSAVYCSAAQCSLVKYSSVQCYVVHLSSLLSSVAQCSGVH